MKEWSGNSEKKKYKWVINVILKWSAFLTIGEMQFNITLEILCHPVRTKLHSITKTKVQ